MKRPAGVIAAGPGGIGKTLEETKITQPKTRKAAAMHFEPWPVDRKKLRWQIEDILREKIAEIEAMEAVGEADESGPGKLCIFRLMLAAYEMKSKERGLQ
jgi:hypothetical protein